MAVVGFCTTHMISYTSSRCPECSITEAPSTNIIRPVLAAFAVAMEHKLRKNDHKTGWRHLPIEALFRMLMLEIEEFKIANEFFDHDEARKELVDVANFCMILHDRLGMEEDKNDGITK